MAHHPATPTPGSGFRRRFPLELTPDEYARLEEAGRTAGSKRAALLAGLAALETRETGSSQAAREHAGKDRLAAHVDARVAALESALSEARQELDAGRAQETSAARRTGDALDAAKAKVRALEADLAAQAAAHANTEAALAGLREIHVDELRCPRCGQFSGPAEWMTRKAKNGVAVYHGPCGYREGGFIDETSVLGRRPVG